ncbi:MAG: kynureninase, partial [Winogradskyella sp.]|nr:kynureninase [Winogradskyella sp.]
MTTFLNTAEFAKKLDQEDVLVAFRSKFHIPKDKNGEDVIYMCGNSLGLQPKITKNYIKQELQDWAELGVE